MPYYGYIYSGYGDFLANNLYCLLLIPILALSLWAQWRVSGNFRRYSTVNNKKHMTGMQVAEAILHANGIFDVAILRCRGHPTAQ